MSKLETFVRRNLTPILLLLLAGGYLVILGELYLYEHWNGIQLVGFISATIGVLCVLAGLFVKRGLRIAAAGILTVLSLTGLMGTVQHSESISGEGAAEGPALAQAAGDRYLPVSFRPGADVRQAGDEESEEESEEGEDGARREGGESEAPPLAPLSLAGLSLMGAAILLAKQD